MNILIDKEIDLNQKDLLNTKAYAKSLANIVLSSPSDQPFTIGLFGEWGSGKSSIIKTLNKDLENQTSKKIKFIIYDSWKYANDSFRRTFLLKVQEELGLQQTELMSSFYVNTNTETEINKKFNLPYLTLVVIVLLLFLGIYSLFGEASKGTVSLAIILSMLGFLTNIFSKAFNEYKVTTQEPHLFAPEQFEACFNEMIGKALKKSSRFKKTLQYITNKSDGDIDKVVIVIDNIDRCHKDVAYELLTNTKNFIGTGLDVIFLIPVDDNALKKHIFKNESIESEEFLRKYFNVTIRIKPYKLTEIFDFASKINDEYSLGLQADTINIIAKEYASNPRRIIQFYNNLQLELLLFKDKYGEAFIKDHEIAICKFLIVREEWNEEYLLLCKSPESFFQGEDTENRWEKKNENYRSFMESTYVSTRSLTYDVLQKILINSDNYDTLPEMITEMIKKEKFEDFAIVLSDTENTEKKVMDYLLFSLNKAIKNGLYTTSIPELLDQVYIFLTHFPKLDKSYYTRLETDIRKNIDIHIGNTLKPAHLVSFSNIAVKRGISFMQKSISKYFQNFDYPKDQFLDSPLFELYEAYIEAADDSQMLMAKKAFPNYLNNTKLKDKVNKKLTAEQLETLYTSEIVEEYLMDKSLLTWNNTDELSNWIWLAKHLPKQLELLDPLLRDANRSISEGLSGTFPYITLMDQLLSASQNVNASIDFIQRLNDLNATIFVSQRQPNGTVGSFLEVATGNDPIVQHYLFECFRVTRGSSPSAAWIITFARFYGEASIKLSLSELLSSHGDRISFSNLKPIIQAFVEVNELTNVILLKTLYEVEDDKETYTDEEIKVHLNRILATTTNNNNNTALLLEHAKIERARPILTAVLTDMPSEELELFLPEVQEIAFDLITSQENISRYKTNFTVLNNVAKHGNLTHIKGIINSIKSNLTDNANSNEALSLILNVKQMDQEIASDLNLFISQNRIANIGDKKLVKEVQERLKEASLN
jgi:hypothetical protein